MPVPRAQCWVPGAVLRAVGLRHRTRHEAPSTGTAHDPAPGTQHGQLLPFGPV